MRTGQTIDAIAEAIASAMPELDATDRRIALAIHRLMSSGEPVEPAEVALASGTPMAQVNERLDSWPGVYRNNQGRVVGFWGHAASKLNPEYRFLIDGKTTYAWCALDTLFIPALLGKTARVQAADPVTGDPVSLLVDKEGVRDVRPAETVVSMVVPDGPFGYDVIESFCHRVLFFASRASGAEWSAQHNETTLLSIEEAFELGRTITRRIAPDVAGATGGDSE